MDILDKEFAEWTGKLTPIQARINIFERIRDIPYTIIPEIIDYRRYTDILRIGKGSCSPKHFLLCEMYRRLGLNVLYVVYPHQWQEEENLPLERVAKLREIARSLPISHHVACKVEIEGKLVLVDATLDAPLLKADFPVNIDWDGKSDTVLPITPCGNEEWYHPSEAPLMEARKNKQFLAFYKEFNSFLEWVRSL